MADSSRRFSDNSKAKAQRFGKHPGVGAATANLPPKQRYFAISASGMAAQHAVPVAIAVAEMAAAKGRFRAIIKLIVDAAMAGAVRPAGKILKRAMVAEPRRQLLGRLPVHADDETACRVHFAGASGRCRHGSGQNRKCKNLHHRTSPHSLARDRSDCRTSGGSAIDGASTIAVNSASGADSTGRPAAMILPCHRFGCRPVAKPRIRSHEVSLAVRLAAGLCSAR
jgi:hypothetical protein